ncbi:PREDICTED: protein FAM57A-like [Amphimedon queenslandica]|uniref:TLC domain-containing protein n=1 Tax=Amphimedon queenslandica TaxID=400682 RepID=A0A1X7V949_AMPQE|nr:PREDICTED: protein FAM57A-like [Amphimedon queenslandica]|eukprot:XP_019850103.1 PREDICTED: protein FAM57A-like [Amphimedon queenslandica]
MSLEQPTLDVPLFSLIWIWAPSLIFFVLLDALLLHFLVPGLLKYFKLSENDQKKRLCLPGHTKALLTERLAGTLTAIAISCIGILILSETYEDVIYAKSSLLLPSAYIFTCNFVYDFYRMYRRFSLSKSEYASLSRTLVLLKMIRNQLSFVIHHLLLICGLVIAHHSFRGGRGDFIIGCYFIMELTNPFLNFYFILKEFQMKDTLVFRVNGVLAILVYVFSRILNYPFQYYMYAHQYHNGDYVSAVKGMLLVCHVFSGVGLILQIYWLYGMIRIFVARAKYAFMINKNK